MLDQSSSTRTFLSSWKQNSKSITTNSPSVEKVLEMRKKVKESSRHNLWYNKRQGSIPSDSRIKNTLTFLESGRFESPKTGR